MGGSDRLDEGKINKALPRQIQREPLTTLSPSIPMFGALIGYVAIAITFVVVACWMLYAIVSELAGLGEQKHFIRHGTLALASLAGGIVLMSHGYSFFLATVIAGGSGMALWFMVITVRDANLQGESESTSSHRPASYEAPNFERYANSLPGLKQQLIGMMKGDRKAAHNMVLYEKSVLASGHPEAWYWKAAIQRLERDRR